MAGNLCDLRNDNSHTSSSEEVAWSSAGPPREDAAEELRSFVEVTPRSGLLLLWESWLRHEVLQGRARTERLSISFNFA